VKFENKVLAPYSQLPSVAVISTSFTHLFSGGYSGGFYSYDWSDVLAQDTAAVFARAGSFDPMTAERFCTEILAKGSTAPAPQLYRNFRGCDPDPDAKLRAEGLLRWFFFAKIKWIIKGMMTANPKYVWMAATP
jgi:peptidyl-dipeptidase Dcp